MLLHSTVVAQEDKMVTKKQLHILAFGDSLTAGYGLPQEHALPTVLEKELRMRNYDVRITNAGVSGDTSAGGLARIAWSLAEAPDAVLLALGANDALRGLPPEQTRKNLAAIIEQSQQAGSKVLLVGMIAPLNMGKEYGNQFNPIYQQLAKQYSIPLYPFLLDGVALDPKLNQPDGIHPNSEGVHIIARRMLPFLESALPKQP